MDITDILEKYRKSKDDYTVTLKQKDFIKALIHENYPGDEIFEVIAKLLKNDVSLWSDLTYEDCKVLIAKLVNRKKATNRQIKTITDLFTIDEVNKFLNINPPFTSYDQLNYWHVKRLLTPVTKFNLRSNDHPIISNIDYEYGYQDSNLCEDGKMYYIKFYDLMMIDYDNMDYKDVIQKLQPYKNNTLFSIYKTFNGYHVFIMSALYNHNLSISTKIMTDLGSDKYYIMFCYKTGYKIRLSEKINRSETYISKYICNYGDETLIHSECKKLLNIHDKFINKKKKISINATTS